MSYSAADLVGKSLIAKVPVNVYASANDSAKPIYTVNPGQTVGVVYSWLLPSADRKTLYWMFQTPSHKYYYTKHIPGMYSLTAIQDQGILTTKQVSEAEKKKAEEESKTTFDKIKEVATKGLFIAGGFYILGELGKEFVKKKA